MSEINKGLLIYNEWFDAMENLSAREFKTMIYAMYNYQIHDIPPPEFKGKSAMMSSVIFPYIKRRKQQSERGKLGAEAKASRIYRASREAMPPPSPQEIERNENSPPYASRGASSDASSQRIVKKSVEENKIAENNLKERSVSEPSADDTPPAPSASPDADDEEALTLALAPVEKQKGYGVYGNVFLSTSEYLLIKNTIDDAEKYIDNFSAKLYAKGYRYPNHAQAILDWWKKDSRLPGDGGSAAVSPTPRGSFGSSGAKTAPSGSLGSGGGMPPSGKTASGGSFGSGGSFDTDSFFEAAVKRSLGGG